MTLFILEHSINSSKLEKWHINLSHSNLLYYLCRNSKMMRNIFATLSLFLSIIIVAQSVENRFESSERGDQTLSKNDNSNAGYDESADGKVAPMSLGPGNDGDELPINNYLPLLIITAVGIIIYTTQKKRNLLS